jgi:hypothetical protein
MVIGPYLFFSDALKSEEESVHE